LYKIKIGKEERYIKDDQALQDILVHAAIRDAQIHVDGLQDQAISMQELTTHYLDAQQVITKLSKVVEETVLRAVLGGVKIDLSNNEAALGSAASLNSWLSSHSKTNTHAARVVAEYDNKTEAWTLQVEKIIHGNHRISKISPDFLDTEDFAILNRTAAALASLLNRTIEVKKGSGDNAKQRRVHSFEEAIDWLMSEAERAISRQRYKGLGEMNPEQLWETTMNIESRTLLQVKIEDAISDWKWNRELNKEDAPFVGEYNDAELDQANGISGAWQDEEVEVKPKKKKAKKKSVKKAKKSV
jgi:DNA gyrase subunit B